MSIAVQESLNQAKMIEKTNSQTGINESIPFSTTDDSSEPPFFGKLFSQMRWAIKCMPSNLDEAPKVRHRVADPIYQNAYSYLSALVSYGEDGSTEPIMADVIKIMAKNGTWNVAEHPGLDSDYGPKKPLYAMTLEELNTFLYERLKIIYEKIADASLNSIPTNVDGHDVYLGFNEHGLGHINRVKEITLQLLKDANASEDDMRTALVAIWAHDLGNVLSRHVHALVSPRILMHLIPELAETFYVKSIVLNKNNKKVRKTETELRDVRRAIYFHNEKTIGAYLRALSKENFEKTGREFTEMEMIQEIRNRFPIFAPALFIGDKGDFGWVRETAMPYDTNLGIVDPHRQVNVNGKTKYLGLSEDRKSFNWVLEFDSESNPKFPQDFESWVAQFWYLYIEKHLMMARSAFAMYPGVKVFTITLVDRKTGIEPMKFSFTTDNMAESFNELRKMYAEAKKVKKEPNSPTTPSTHTDTTDSAYAHS